MYVGNSPRASNEESIQARNNNMYTKYPEGGNPLKHVEESAAFGVNGEQMLNSDEREDM